MEISNQKRLKVPFHVQGATTCDPDAPELPRWALYQRQVNLCSAASGFRKVLPSPQFQAEKRSAGEASPGATKPLTLGQF